MIKRTERGWPGHFCCSSKCIFRRNTLLEKNNIRIIVSTIGAMKLNETDNKYTEVGCGRYYETMVFHAKKDGIYWDADVGRQIYFDSNWTIDKVTENADKNANDMHEKIVKELTNKLEKGQLK